MATGLSNIAIERLEVSVYTVPTDFPESDGTLEWDSTTMILIEATAGEARGFGYTYADTAAARLIQDKLAEVVRRRNVMSAPGAWFAMVHAIRNLGRPGIASMAIAANDLVSPVDRVPWNSARHSTAPNLVRRVQARRMAN